MSRAGARTLSDLDGPALVIACDPCGRRGRYNIARLIAAHGDEALPVLLARLANCPRQGAASIYDRCKARFVSPL